MIFFLIIIVIAIISFVWSIVSLRNISAHKETKKVKEDLRKGKVIFTSDKSSPDES